MLSVSVLILLSPRIIPLA